MELSDDDRITFQNEGVLHLKKIVPRSRVEHAKNSVLAELDRLKYRTRGKISAGNLKSLPFFQQITHLSQSIKIGPEFNLLFSEELKALLTKLAGAPLKPSAPNPQILLSLPNHQEWSLSNLNWHLDMTVPSKNEIAGVQVFVLIDEVRPTGGGTLALAGSHRLHYLTQDMDQNAHSLLRKDLHFSGLFSDVGVEVKNILKPHTIQGVKVSVREMAGHAGDVFLMDMRVLHSPALNATKHIRMMATQRFIKN